MALKLMYIPIDDIQNNPLCRLLLVVKTYGHPTKLTNQSKFNKSPIDFLYQRIKKLLEDFGD